MKFGAFNACPKCEAKPVSEDDYAMSLAMTDHYFPRDELEKMGSQLAHGQKLHIDPEVKWRFIQLLKSEGIGQESAESTPFIPTEALDLLETDRNRGTRKWWKFWRSS
jgi:hypothetical protein